MDAKRGFRVLGFRVLGVLGFKVQGPEARDDCYVGINALIHGNTRTLMLPLEMRIEGGILIYTLSLQLHLA